MTQLLPPKKEVALALLERSNVDVYLDPRAKGVVVPPQFRKEPRLILKIGLNMPVPIPDLRLDDESMSCTLSFNRSPFYCVVPWSSCFAMVGEDGRGMVWPDDVPQELAVKVVDPDQPGSARDGGVDVERDAKMRARGEGPRSLKSDSSRTDSSRTDSSRTDSSRTDSPRTDSPRTDSPRRAAAAAGARTSKIARDATREGGPERSDEAASNAAKKKKGKKKDEGRPVLVAVPSGDRAEPQRGVRAEPQMRESAEPSAEPRGPASQRDREAPRRDGVSAIPSSPTPSRRSGGMPPSSQPAPSLRRPPASERPREGQVRPKRELPPYLRVVK